VATVQNPYGVVETELGGNTTWRDFASERQCGDGAETIQCSGNLFEPTKGLVRVSCLRAPGRVLPLAMAWPLHDTAITNIVGCMAYKRGVGGGVV